MTSSAAEGRAAERFRLPVEPPARDLIIASLAAIAGACQLFAWALARLPSFFLVLGLILMAGAIGLALTCLVRHRRLSWVLHLDDRAVRVRWRRREQTLSWDTVDSVSYENFQLQILARNGHRLVLPVDRTRAAHDGAGAIRRAVERRLPEHSPADHPNHP